LFSTSCIFGCNLPSAEAAHLHIAWIIVVARTAEGYGDVCLLTLGHQLHVNELCSIIGVDTQQGKGKEVVHALERGYHCLLCAIEQGEELSPSRGDVSQRQRLQERPISLMATMSAPVRLP
jgi:hypothetical protein